MSKRIAAVSVDLDEIRCYAQVHGLGAPEGSAAHAVYERCLPRFLNLFDACNLRSTFFAVGLDLERARNRELLSRVHRNGHELANHSYGHRYELTRLSSEQMREDIDRCSAAIEEVCGQRPLGFRAPGYVLSDALVEVLKSAQMTYDSSVFPCASYYAAKLAVLGAMRLRGRRSHSIVDRPRVLRAPRAPYRMGQHYWQKGGGLLEIPVGVTPFQLPYIGTALVLGGARGARVLTRQMLGSSFVHLQLHGIDLADAVDDELSALQAHQPDLRRSASEKTEALFAAIELLRAEGYGFVRLCELGESLSG